MMNEPLSTIMTGDVITVGPNDTLDKVREIFSRKRIHHLPVVDENNELLGILTTYDMWKANKTYEQYKDIPVHDVMTMRMATLQAHQKIGTAAEVFLENRFHALPIVDEGYKLKGIVTTFDVLKYEFKKAYPGQEI